MQKKKKNTKTENGARKAMVNVLVENIFIFYENTSLEGAKKTKKQNKMLMQDVWYPSELVINYTLNIFFYPKLIIGHLLTFPAVLDEQ